MEQGRKRKEIGCKKELERELERKEEKKYTKRGERTMIKTGNGRGKRGKRKASVVRRERTKGMEELAELVEKGENEREKIEERDREGKKNEGWKGKESKGREREREKNVNSTILPIYFLALHCHTDQHSSLLSSPLSLFPLPFNVLPPFSPPP